jgi:hypothetical protein
MARGTKLEPWMIKVVEGAIAQGLPLKLVAGLIRVSPSLFHKWYAEGSAESCTDPAKLELASTVDQGRAKAALAGITLMQMHAAGDWRAALELLKVSDPDTWNTASKVQVDKEVTITHRDLSGLTETALLELQRAEDTIKRLTGGDE